MAAPFIWDTPFSAPRPSEDVELTEEERKGLISRLGISFVHQKMVGTSFEVGRTFFERVLEEEPEEERAYPASAPSSIRLSPRLSPSIRRGRSKRNQRVPTLLSAMNKRASSESRSRSAQPHVKFALPPKRDSNEIEDRSRWDETRSQLEHEGPVSIQVGRPSQTMLALEQELVSKRAELTNMVSQPSSAPLPLAPQAPAGADESMAMHTPPDRPPGTPAPSSSQHSGTSAFHALSRLHIPNEAETLSPAHSNKQGARPPMHIGECSPHAVMLSPLGSETASPMPSPTPAAPASPGTKHYRYHWHLSRHEQPSDATKKPHEKRLNLHRHKKRDQPVPEPAPPRRRSASMASLESLEAEPTSDVRVHRESERITSETVVHAPPSPSNGSEPSVNLLKTPLQTHNDLLGLSSALPVKNHITSSNQIPVGQGDLSPPPVDEVLSRDTVAPVPAAVPVQADSFAIYKRDRMLVKVQVASNDVSGTDFDEFEARRYDIRSYRWAEYVVVLRPGRLELWSEASIRGRLLGDAERLKPRYTVSLRPGESSLSLYSETDRLFCLVCPRSESTVGRFPFRRHGSTILIFNARTFSISSDWMWLLWREMGGTLPPHLFVYLPSISMRVRIPIPPLPDIRGPSREYDVLLDVPRNEQLEEYEGYMASALIGAAERLVKAVPQWASLVQDVRSRGLKPAFVWRSGTMYNWVQYSETADGAPRYWHVLAGTLLTNRRRAPVLELVMNNHYPTQVLHPSGCALREPCAVEGFVGRLRRLSSATSRVYLSVHDGLIFLLRESNACVPDKFAGVPLGSVQGATRKERIYERIQQFSRYERTREWQQIRFSEGFIDLREVCAIGHVGTNVVLSTELQRHMVHTNRESSASSSMPEVEWVHDYDGTRTAIEKRLNFCDEQLDPDFLLNDRSGLRSMRQFHLYLDNGREVIFECASAALAREWIVHLFMLTVYWRCRSKTDIRMIMNASGGRRNLIYNSKKAEDVSLLSLPYLWNWCRMYECRAVSLSGHLFWRTNVRHPFRRRIFVLCNGHMYGFKLMSSTRSSSSRQNAGIVYRRKGSPIILRDAYVYTGQLSDRSSDLLDDEAPTLRTGAHDIHEVHERLPRLYRDGLTSSESHEECSFVLRVRSVPDPNPPKHLSGHSATPLARRDSTEYTFRARTVLERDLWVRHISTEIEKTMRSQPERESLLRHFGRVY